MLPKDKIKKKKKKKESKINATRVIFVIKERMPYTVTLTV